MNFLIDRLLIDQIKMIIKQAGQIALQLRRDGLKVQNKADGSLITNADIKVSEYICAALFEIIPTIPIISEESEELKNIIVGRPLAKPASGSKMLGDLGAKGSASVHKVHEDPSTKSTKQITAEVGFGEGSNTIFQIKCNEAREAEAYNNRRATSNDVTVKNGNWYNEFWLIDPIDGTKGYIKGEDIFTINIAFINDNKAKYGFIYLPVTDRLYYTDEHLKLVIEQDGQILSKAIFDKSQMIAAISKNYCNQKTKEFLQNNNIEHVMRISSSYKLCLIAEGLADIYPRFSETSEWDIAAGHALVKAAGGNLIDQNTNQELLYGKKDWVNPSFIAFAKKS